MEFQDLHSLEVNFEEGELIVKLDGVPLKGVLSCDIIRDVDTFYWRGRKHYLSSPFREVILRLMVKTDEEVVSC